MAIQTTEALQKRLRKVKNPQGMAVDSSPDVSDYGTQRETFGNDGTGTVTGTDAVAKTRRGMGPAKYKNRKEDVAGLTADVLSEDNRLMRLAATKGVQYANRRGLMNSSIAAGASMDAQAEYAVDIAQKQAGINSRRNLSAQEARQDRQQTRLERQLDRRQTRLDYKFDSKLLAREEEMRLNIEKLGISAQEKTDMTNMVTDIFDQYQKSVNTYLSNPDLTADQRNAFLSGAGEFLQPQMELIEELYGVDIKWLDSAFNPSTGQTKKQDEADAKKAEEEKDAAKDKNKTETENPHPPGTTEWAQWQLANNPTNEPR